MAVLHMCTPFGGMAAARRANTIAPSSAPPSGATASASALMVADIQGGPMGAARAAAELLARAFMVPGET